MPRVLLAWEFGGDLGHVRRGLAIARRLRDRGHEPLLAFADIGPLAAQETRGLPWTQAPVLPRPASPDPSPLNASDILLNLGFADTPALAGALRAWEGLFRLWKPVALVADYAPTALVAAHAAGLPTIAIGSGFPPFPVGEPMPALRPWAPVETGLLAERDARLVASVGRALERAWPRAPAPRRAAEIFAAGEDLVCTWPLFDAFGPRDGVEYLGPQDDGLDARAVEWSPGKGPRIFAYLKPRDARFTALLAAIGEAAGEAIVAAPGLASSEAAKLSSERVRVVGEPVALGPALSGADLCVSHSGPGIALAAGAAGVPQALLPAQLEQYLVARRLVDAGVARALGPHEDTGDLVRWLLDALDPRTREAARTRREEAARPSIDAAERIARRLST